MNTAKQYSISEEVFNAISHGVGALLAVIGTTIMVTISALYYTPLTVVSTIIYGLAMVIMYTMSTLYHAIPFPKAKRIFQMLDHDSIYLLIAGTYTPIMLLAVKGSMRSAVILIAVWVIAAVGIILNKISLQRFKKVSVALYLAMGWAVIIDIHTVVTSLEKNGLITLVAGGLCYTVGVIFYKMKSVKFMHGVWHLFVLAGSVLHYLCILLFVLK